MKHSFILALFLFISFPLFAQLTDQRVFTEGDLHYPYSAIDLDVDEDGLMDLVVLNYQQSKIDWYANLGGGDFGEVQLLGINEYFANRMRGVDIDGDGDDDLMFAYLGTQGQLFWRENLGAGLFSTPIMLKEYKGFTDVKFGDVEGDGDVDMLISTVDYGVADEKQLSWLVGNNDGTFITEVIDSIESDRIYLNDIDEDGDLDLFRIDQHKLYYLEFSGGEYQAEIEVVNSYSDVEDIWVLVFSDYDGDGLKDIIFSEGSFWSTDEGKVYWVKNEGGGSFGGLYDENIIEHLSPFSRRIVLADYDNDGDDDLFAISGNKCAGCSIWDSRISLMERIEVDSFAAEKILYTNFNSGYSLIIQDFDEDNIMDIVFSSDHTLKMINGNLDSNSFQEPTLISQNSPYTFDFQAGDFNNDGIKDVFFHDIGSYAEYWVQFGLGDNSFGEPTKIPNFNGMKLMDLAVYDLDGDNQIEWLYASNPDHKIAYLKGDFSQGFNETVVIDSLTNVDYLSHINSIDINQDGLMDVVLTYRESDYTFSLYEYTTGWYLNLGNDDWGTFQELIVDGNYLTDLNQVDIDSDGDMDVLAYYSTWSNVVIYKNLGNGELAPGEIVPTQFDTLSLGLTYAIPELVFDFDEDGDQDMIYIRNNAGVRTYHIQVNNGMGQFDQELDFDTPDFLSTSQLTKVDLNKDNRPDFLCSLSTGEDYRALSWFNIDTLGFINEHLIIDTFSSTIYSSVIGRIFFEDINEDPGNELILGLAEKIVWYDEWERPPLIKGSTFFDLNQNGIREPEEFLLQDIKVQISPNSISSSEVDGTFLFYVEEGAYTLFSEEAPLWELTTTDSYNINIPEIYFQYDSTYYFGYSPVDSFTLIDIDLTASSILCNSTSTLWINYQNEGTTTTSGQITLEVDDLTTFESASIPPDSILGNTLYWHYDNLYPTYTEQIAVYLNIPNEGFIGEMVNYEANITTYEDLNLEKLFVLSEAISCSHHPNEKVVSPSGYGSENFTLFEDTLTYTIRFQNTGNDTAYNIIIQDTLSELLDITTFEKISSSHPVEVQLDVNNRVAGFYFRDIYLPDSNVNELASHGFIKFRILPKEGLPEYSVISNNAHVYFDENPAILTNTVDNTMVLELPALAILNASPNEIDFGSIGIDELNFLNPIEQLTIQNPGGLPLEVSGINISGSVFEIAEEGFTVLANDQVTLPVYFNPISIGIYNETLTIESNVGNLEIGVNGEVTLETGMNQITNADFEIYPNPNNGRFYVKTSKEINEVSLKVYNLEGKMIREILLDNSTTTEVDLGEMPKGLYVVKLESEEGVFVEKLVVD